ncbi:hypothetical protein NNO_1837 [Hydrogenimonas sp.]|nr:hypothetical protein NNO_1837 [Hydrogenimonas sp.]
MRWVKGIALALSAVVVWVLLTLLFVSKERLCNTALNSAAEKAGVTLCFDGYDSSALGCSMKRITLLYGHSPVAKIKKADFSPWKIEVSGIRLEGIAADMLPAKIESVRYTPFNGRVSARGDFGVLDGNVSLMKRKAEFVLLPSSLMKRRYSAALRTFRYKNGRYRYDLSF